MKLFFSCFSSHFSSSSKTMKFSSKCILSPGSSRGNREPSQISLSSSLSRKLRSNRSIRSGQASPMFPTAAKKKGGAFENPEPSSPKVTCIGQVRVKTRRQGKKIKTRSMRRKEANPNLSGQKSQNFEYQNHQNLRQECLPHQNQRWVHLPLTICEALRGFGAEFNNCFFPCWSCKSIEKDEENKVGGGTGGSGRGAAFAGWLAALEEGEKDRTDRLEGSQRRRVLEDIDIEAEKQDDFVGEEGKARVSVCIPPKNALLLMRCRSDPVKMAALANRFWESPAQKYEEREGNGDEDGEVEDEVQRHIEIPTQIREDNACGDHLIPDAEIEATVMKGFERGSREILEEKAEDGRVNCNLQSETLFCVPSHEGQVDLEKLEVEDVQPNMLQDGEEELNEKEGHIEQKDAERASSPAIMAQISTKTTVEDEKDTTESLREDKETATRDRPVLDYSKLPEQKVVVETKERVNQSEPKRGSSSGLPECLLLMMCEPKLSMEVSRETWVSNTDFIRWHPEKPVKKKDSGDEPSKRISVDSKPPLPPRSSCSFPAPAAGMSMATMIEQKLGESNACEPLVLTRCNSEPMRSSAILAPEACFWKNRKLEPNHPAATLRIGEAGVGF
ncbi:uncharacterized protein LOC129315163 [Prosopis cineraria]|uniref:uncharacterized protein LOC129315163 n=1 Tax=Prosopis cineraria TaxID=364024 RepID=UPI00240FFDBA|nr:uncharacterized protein LOC129315163 [Prosopis cineraria]